MSGKWNPLSQLLSDRRRLTHAARTAFQKRETYGNPTPLEIESPTLPPGRFNLPDLWAAHFPAPPCLPLRLRATDAGCRQQNIDIAESKSQNGCEKYY